MTNKATAKYNFIFFTFGRFWKILDTLKFK